MNAPRTAVLSAGILALLAVLPAQAEKMDERLREQLRSTITQMRALADENASLKAQLAQATAKPREDTEVAARAQRDLGRLRGEQGQLRQKLEQQAAAHAAELAAQKKLAETERTARLEAQKKLLAEHREAERNSKALAECSASNQALVSIADELAGRYRDRGMGDVLLAKEPITGLRGAQLERRVQAYEIRVDDLTVREPPPAAAAETDPVKNP
jgi:chromosome segregation ATPase